MSGLVLGIDPGWTGGAALINLGRRIFWPFCRIGDACVREVSSRIYSSFHAPKSDLCRYRRSQGWIARCFLGQDQCGGQAHGDEDNDPMLFPSQGDVRDRNSFWHLGVVGHRPRCVRQYSRAYISFPRPSYNYWGLTCLSNYTSRRRPLFAFAPHALPSNNCSFLGKPGFHKNGNLVSNNRTAAAFLGHPSCGNIHSRANENRPFHSILLRSEQCQ